jgi:hypothetical protein
MMHSSVCRLGARPADIQACAAFRRGAVDMDPHML